MSAHASGTIDIGRALDEGAWSGLQKTVVLMAALTIIFDGFDNQLMGFAIPAIIQEWGVARSDFAPVVAIGLCGMALGTALAGYLSDRFGRRAALIGSVFVFGAATCAIAFSNNLVTLTILRFIAAAGVGGALPNASTLTAEFTPMRRRAMAVSLTIVCVPLGGMIAGIVAAQLLPSVGWRTLFVVGGALPIALAVALVFLLPESPRYLTRHPARWGELAGLLRRMGRAVPEDARFEDVAEQRAEHGKVGVAAILGADYLRDTLGLWLACFSCLICVYMAFSWLPTLLTAEGLSLGVASSGLAAYNFGGVLGPLCCAALIGRLGSRWPMLFGCLGGVLSALVLKVVPIAPDSGHTALIVALGVHGFFVNAVQTTMYALAAHVYPTAFRATGVAAALTVGRVGSILSAFLGAAALGGGGAAYFNVLVLFMSGTLVGLALVRRHIPAAVRATAPAPAGS